MNPVEEEVQSFDGAPKSFKCAQAWHLAGPPGSDLKDSKWSFESIKTCVINFFSSRLLLCRDMRRQWRCISHQLSHLMTMHIQTAMA